MALSQGLEHTDLIKLKRTVSKQKVSPAAAAAMRNVKGEAFISRRSSGMSFDFNHRDGRMYIAGTEDGHIYKCSTSYSEQYLETYSGHMGPVYRVQWSPFQSNLFISSSADWSVKLWTEGKVSKFGTTCFALCACTLHIALPGNVMFADRCCMKTTVEA